MTMAKAKTKSVRLITKDFSRAIFARSFAFSFRFALRFLSATDVVVVVVCVPIVGRARHQIKVCVREEFVYIVVMELALCTRLRYYAAPLPCSAEWSKTEKQKSISVTRGLFSHGEARVWDRACVHYFTIFVFRLSDCLGIACSFIRFISVRKAFRNKSRTIFFMLIICSGVLCECCVCRAGCRLLLLHYCLALRSALLCSAQLRSLYLSLRFFAILFFVFLDLFWFVHSSLVYFVFLCASCLSLVLFSAKRWFGETPTPTRILVYIYPHPHTHTHTPCCWHRRKMCFCTSTQKKIVGKKKQKQ